MGKKKKQEIDLSNIKTVRLEINFSVPKEQFDELLRRQLSKRVILIHELGQLGRSEELFDCSCNRFDIDQEIGRAHV